MPSKKGKKPGNPGVPAGCTARTIPVRRAVFVSLLEGGGPESLGKSELNFERRSRNDKSFEKAAVPSEKTKNPRNRMIPGKILGAPGVEAGWKLRWSFQATRSLPKKASPGRSLIGWSIQQEKQKIPETLRFLGNSVARQEGLEPPTFWFVADLTPFFGVLSYLKKPGFMRVSAVLSFLACAGFLCVF